MAEALKIKEEGIRGGGRGGNGGSVVASSLGGFGEYPKRLRSFLHDVRVEMRQVNWPSRQDVISTTIVVTITVAFFGVFFFFTDTIAERSIGWLINYVRH
jgi:preprotein translocase subunit SecE